MSGAVAIEVSHLGKTYDKIRPSTICRFRWQAARYSVCWDRTAQAKVRPFAF